MVQPAYLTRPPRVRSLVEQVTKVCASVGRHLDEEQRLAVDVLTGMKADGTPASLEAGVISARQNLKTFVLEGIVLTLLLDPHNHVRLGIWSAQEFDTAQETFRNFVELFESEDYPHLHRRVKDIKRGSGKEEIELIGGRRLKFKARSGKGARGLAGDFVVLDEAFALDPAHMGSLLPTLSTRRRARVLYGSSAGKADSDVLRRLRDRARPGGPGAPAYVEWCAPGSLADPGCSPECQHDPGTPGCVLDREDYWLMANPAAGRRITFEYLRDERKALPPEEFARERLGWWDAPDVGAVPISPEDWAASAVRLTTEERARLDRPVFFLDVQPGGAAASIAVAAMRRGSDLPHVELAEAGPGTDWVVARAAELMRQHPDARFAAESSGAVGALFAQLDREDIKAGLNLELFTVPDMGRACGHMQNLGRQFTHHDDPRFTTALTGAVKRDLGEGLWAWGRRKSTTNISPLVAATGALWLLEQHADEDYDLADSFG